jgi:molybdopterin converting factor small subunit
MNQGMHRLSKRECRLLKVTVKFVGSVKEVIGDRERAINLKKGTVQELLEAIFNLYPKQKRKLELAGVFIDGAIVKHSEMQSPILKEGDEVSLILPVAGG